MRAPRYPVYFLYWYKSTRKSTNTDAAHPHSKNFGAPPDRSANQTPYGDFGGRKVFIGGTADKDEAELR